MTSFLMSSPPISMLHRLFQSRYLNSRDVVVSSPSFHTPSPLPTGAPWRACLQARNWVKGVGKELRLPSPLISPLGLPNSSLLLPLGKAWYSRSKNFSPILSKILNSTRKKVVHTYKSVVLCMKVHGQYFTMWNAAQLCDSCMGFQCMFLRVK